MQENQTHTPSLVLGIVSIVFSLIPIISFITGGIALYQTGKLAGEYNVKAARICSIIGLILGGISFIVNIIIFVLGGSLLSALFAASDIYY